MKRLLFSMAAMAMLGACAATGSAGAGAATSPAPASAMDYVRMAGASDLYEIQSSQAVLQTTQSERLRNFAQMMVDHHTKTTQQVTAAARSAGMTPPPPQLDPPKAAMLRELQQAQGAARDAAYVRQQVMAHQEALALHSGYARDGDSAPLKAAASQATPIVQQHLTEIQSIQSAGGR